MVRHTPGALAAGITGGVAIADAASAGEITLLLKSTPAQRWPVCAAVGSSGAVGAIERGMAVEVDEPGEVVEVDEPVEVVAQRALRGAGRPSESRSAFVAANSATAATRSA